MTIPLVILIASGKENNQLNIPYKITEENFMDINGMEKYLEGLSIPDMLKLLSTCNKSKCEYCTCHKKFGCNKAIKEN